MQEISVGLNLSKFNPLNLVYNPSFEAHGLGAAAVPDGWVLEGTPPALLADTGDIGYGAVSQKITADAALEGIKYTITGLKALTKYAVHVRAKVTAGTDIARMLTTGAGVNMAAVNSISATWETIRGHFTTDNAGTAVVLKLMAVANTDVVWFDGVEVNEGEGIAFHDKPVLYSDARFKVLSFTRAMNGANATVAYTGIGFSPKALIVFGGINNTTTALFAGAQVGTGCGSLPSRIDSGVGVILTGNTEIFRFIPSGGGQLGTLVSWDADGFTINWVLSGNVAGTIDCYVLALK